MKTRHKLLLLAGGGGIIGRISGFSGNGLIGVWPLNELSGTAVNCTNNLSLSVANGHSGVTLGKSGPYGLASPLYDGINDSTNIFSAALASIFDGQTGTQIIFIKAINAGSWTDGTQRIMCMLYASAGNFIDIFKLATNNTVRYTYRAGLTTKQVDLTISSTGWNMYALTWSLTLDQVKAYLNNAQIGTTQTGLGTWSGALASATLGQSGGNAYYGGWLSMTCLFNRVLSLDEIKYIYGGGPG